MESKNTNEHSTDYETLMEYNKEISKNYSVNIPI